MATEPVLPVDGLARAADGRLTGAELAAGAGRRPPARRPRRSPTPWPPRSIEHARAGRPRTTLRDDVEALGRPTVELPLLAGHMDVGCAVRARRPPRGPPAQPRSPRERRSRRAPGPGRPPGPAGAHRARDGPGRADRRPRDPDRRLLRRRRRGQDDDVGRAGAGRGRGRADRRRPHHRPGPAAGAVASAWRSWTTSRGRSTSRGPTGRTARDDAGHEADVRRRRRGALDARAGPADPRQPLLPVAVLVVRRDAGVHGDGEAGPAAGQRRSGT